MKKAVERFTGMFLSVAMVLGILAAAPVNVDAASRKPGKASAEWAELKMYNNQVKIGGISVKNAKKVQIFLKKKGSSFRKIATVKAGTFQYEYRKSLKASTKYYYKVRGVSGSKKGSFSKVKTFRTVSKSQRKKALKKYNKAMAKIAYYNNEKQVTGAKLGELSKERAEINKRIDELEAKRDSGSLSNEEMKKVNAEIENLEYKIEEILEEEGDLAERYDRADEESIEIMVYDIEGALHKLFK